MQMQSNMKYKIILAATLISILNVQISTVFAQGTLTPPGAPAPTMKTLGQIEPRTPVDASHTPGNVVAQFIINQPGSYYLTTNIVGVSGKRGIQIEASNVTLDLNGFSLLGNSNSIDGIYSASVYNENVVIRNGTISGWPNTGLNYYASDGTFEQLNVTGNGVGLLLADECLVKGCTVSRNLQSGITVAGPGCSIVENLCVGNNVSSNSAAAGILVVSPRNRIEGNHIICKAPTDYGISCYGVGGNIIIRNSVEGGGGASAYHYDPTAIVGPIITNTASGVITNSNPWANFAF
jgi:hypothetical protein